MEEVREYSIAGTRLVIADEIGSQAARWVANELALDEYGLSRISFRPGNVIIDVGAHVGLFSLYLALRHPEVTIVAFEPEPHNFRNLAANVARHRALNIFAFNLAVTADGASFSLCRPPANSGGASGYFTETEGYRASVASSVTLDSIFARFVPGRCALLKLDCEGAEHEIVPPCSVLPRVDWFCAEFHMNRLLAAAGHSNQRLADRVWSQIPRERTTIGMIAMGE